MTARHECLTVAGRQVGDLITVGTRVRLFTVDPALEHLDGEVFSSADDAHRAVRSAIAGFQTVASPAFETPMPARRVVLPDSLDRSSMISELAD